MASFDWFVISGCLCRNGCRKFQFCDRHGDNEILQMQINAIPKNTKKATKYGLRVFQGNLGEFE